MIDTAIRFRLSWIGFKQQIQIKNSSAKSQTREDEERNENSNNFVKKEKRACWQLIKKETVWIRKFYEKALT